MINLPDNLPTDRRGIEEVLADIISGKTTPTTPTYDVTDPNFKFEPDLSVDYGKAMEDYNFDRSAYENYMEATRTAEDEARDDLADGVENVFKEEEEEEEELTFKEKMAKMGKALDVLGASKDGTPTASIEGKIFSKVGASKVPQTRRFEDGGIASLMPMYMDDGGYASGFGFGNFGTDFTNPFLDDLDLTDEELNDYIEAIKDSYGAQNAANSITRADAYARGYGAPQADRITQGTAPSKLNYEDTPSNILPGADIRIYARDENPAAYKFYPSEVSKLYSQMKGVPFSPLVAPPKEATYVDSLQPRRIQSQLYAKDGTYVQGYADGTGSMGAIRKMASGAKRGISSLAEGITSIPSEVYNYLNPANENVEDVKVIGIPKYPYGHPSEAVENLHDRRRDINDIIEEGYYIDREQRDVIYLDDNPKAFNALLNELKLIDKELQMTQGMGGNTRKMNEANQTMAYVIKNLRGYADGTGSMGVEDYPRRQELITGPGGERGDEIPAMLSDGEFVTNAAAVRGMGIMAGANPEDEYEQRLLGARQMYDYQRQAEEMAKRYA